MDREKDIAKLLFGGGQKAVNVKFFRGSRDLISVEELLKEVHSALMQRKLKPASVSKEPPKSDQPTVKVRELVAAL
jgi:hypothetical protein